MAGGGAGMVPLLTGKTVPLFVLLPLVLDNKPCNLCELLFIVI
ncbi:MAG: hypothetical protein PG978_000052 [Wolbachia endosymbiont of Ctenocephalides felis wCfeF]|nr:MAG: hypothetical protein PG978_000052 [Wolbachia endosymbiont of Ctenocephalides felis wCfeF]